jgi:hypothetical protein
MLTRKVLVCVLMTAVCLTVVTAQEPIDPADGKSTEQQYDELISGALRLQVRADSLARAANVLRRELAFVKDPEKHEMEQRVLRLEKESFTIQQEADYYYSRARMIELKLIAGRGGGQAPAHLPSPDQASPSGENDPAAPGGSEPTFLTLGKYDTGHMLSADDMSRAREFEPEFVMANALIEEVAGLTADIERLIHLLDTDPRRRDRRRINQRIDELTVISFEKKMEAMAVYKEINNLRYTAATAFLEKKRGQVADAAVRKSGLAHEELAHESFSKAQNLHETAIHLRSDKYFEDFTIKAHAGELFALGELEKALDIYDAPPVTSVAEVREEKKVVPLRDDGRIDTALALSRTRTAAADDTVPVVRRVDDGGLVYMDFGFSVLPSSPYSDANPIPSAVKLPHGLVYTIQLGVYNSPMPPANFRGLAPLMTERDPGSRANRYFAGIFRTAHDAEKGLIEVNRQGFSDAFLVAYNDGLKIPVTRARQMERGRQQAAAEPAVVPPPPPLPVANEPPGIVTFKIQLGAFRELLLPDVHRTWLKLAGGKNVEHTRNINGLYVYSIGNFNTFEEALQIRDLFIKQGISDAFIVPYKGSARISMEEANKLLDQ